MAGSQVLQRPPGAALETRQHLVTAPATGHWLTILGLSAGTHPQGGAPAGLSRAWPPGCRALARMAPSPIRAARPPSAGRLSGGRGATSRHFSSLWGCPASQSKPHGRAPVSDEGRRWPGRGQDQRVDDQELEEPARGRVWGRRGHWGGGEVAEGGGHAARLAWTGW